MKDNSSADGSSINNMKTSSEDLYHYFYVVKAVFEHCVLHVFFIRCTIPIPDYDSDTVINVPDVESQIHIVQSYLIHWGFYMEIKAAGISGAVVHLTVSNSSINGWFIQSELGSTAVGIVQITNTSLTNTSVRLFMDCVNFFIDNCTFIQSSLYSENSIIVYIVNSRFEIKCQSQGCELALAASGQFSVGISYLTLICDFYKIKMCYGIYLDNDELIGHGNYELSNSVVKLYADNLVINNNSISGLQVDITKYTRIIQIRSSILKDTVVRSTYNYIDSYAAYFIDNCTFIQSSLHSEESIIVYIVNSRFYVEGQSKGCTLTVIGPNQVDMGISDIRAMCDLFQIKMCYGIFLTNVELIATESEPQFLITDAKQAVIENCTFSISTSLPIYVTENLIFKVQSEIMKLINVKVNVTKLRSLLNIPLFSINTAEIISQSVLLFCPLSFKVIEKISDKDNNKSQFLCQKDVCQSVGYSLMGHSELTSVANIHNETKHVLSELVPSCFPCPVGASCEQERVVALPNYWGTRKGHVISMFRCPQDYCCKNSE